MKKINRQYDIEKILMEIESLDIQSDQISLQSPDGTYTSGTGGIKKMVSEGFSETDFDNINILKNWETARFIADLNLYRTRVMIMGPKTCYSWHKDPSPRVHLALETHEYCFFVENKEIVHIPADGYPYLIDTTKYHTAMNCTLDTKRIHLVGCVREDSEYL